MAQHDYVIDNQSFPATRSDLNSLFQAIASCNSGTSAPSTTFANQLWYDTSANILYIRSEADDANIPLLQLDQSADVASTLATIIDILDASGTNTAGTDLTIRAGAGTGTGAGGNIILQTANAGSSGSSVNSHATAVTIDDAGNVGIGASPDHPLRVSSSGFGTIAKFASDDGSNNPRLLIYGSSSGMHIQRTSGSGASNLIFNIGGSEGGGTEAARFDSSRNLLVGGTTYGGAGLSLAKPDSSGVFSILSGAGTGFHMRFGNVTNGAVGSISSSTTSTTFSTSSDYRLKENVTDIADGITRLKLLNPSRFNFIADADRTVDGFLAHEVSDVVPEAITGEKDAMMDEEYEVTPAVLDDDGNVVTDAVMGTRSVPSYQGIDQSKLVPLLTAALQEAVGKIEALETRVAALEA